MATNPSHRPTYTDDQLRRYLAFMRAGTLENVRHAITANSLKELTRLRRSALCKVPFGNVALHYSPHKYISLDSASLYHKIMERPDEVRGINGMVSQLDTAAGNE